MLKSARGTTDFDPQTTPYVKVYGTDSIVSSFTFILSFSSCHMYSIIEKFFLRAKYSLIYCLIIGTFFCSFTFWEQENLSLASILSATYEKFAFSHFHANPQICGYSIMSSGIKHRWEMKHGDPRGPQSNLC